MVCVFGSSGHVVGLALSGGDAETVASTLRARGVESNKLNGEWTGVSFARYTKLVHLLRSAWEENPATPAVMMMLQLVHPRYELLQHTPSATTTATTTTTITLREPVHCLFDSIILALLTGVGEI